MGRAPAWLLPAACASKYYCLLPPTHCAPPPCLNPRSFRATLTGVECVAVLPDGRERKVALPQAFSGLGPRRRDAEQAAAGLVRDWFVAAGLWDPDTLEGPPPANIGLVRAADACCLLLLACCKPAAARAWLRSTLLNHHTPCAPSSTHRPR